ncbi:MAG: hypothetical protein AAF657_03905 [Acidobacteriota bacterium]
MSFIRRAFIAFVASASLAGTLHADVEVRTLEQDLLLGDTTKVHINLSFGDISVEGIDSNQVEIEMVLDCARENIEACRTRARRVQLAPRMSQKELKIRLKRTPWARLKGIKARMKVRLPSHVSLEVDVKSGSVYITGLTSHINVDSGAGDIDILGRRDRTAMVDVDSGFGKADLWLGDGRVEGSGWPRSIDWRGSGEAEINVDLVGTGDVSIRLE